MKFSSRFKWGTRFESWGLPWLACLIGWHRMKVDNHSGAHCQRCRYSLKQTFRGVK